MLTTIVVVLALVAVVAVAAWWFFDFDMPEVAIPAAVPGVGAAILYWYWGPLAWATVARRAGPRAPPVAILRSRQASSGCRRRRKRSSRLMR
jgi:hypothetical protein